MHTYCIPILYPHKSNFMYLLLYVLYTMEDGQKILLCLLGLNDPVKTLSHLIDAIMCINFKYLLYVLINFELRSVWDNIDPRKNDLYLFQKFFGLHIL